METADILDRAFVLRVPALIKAKPMDATGRRIVEVEASTEEVDFDGDVVLQSALIGSAANFVANGHLDIDHLSEFGARMGIPNPSSYIVGRPMDVWAMKGGRTFVKGEIARSSDGAFRPDVNKYDELWQSLQSDPPVQWFSSIYGFPTDLDDCKEGICGANGATRFVIKAIDWRSLAFTRTPKNTALSSPTRIVSAKAYLVEIAKAYHMSPIPTEIETGETAAGMGSTPPGIQIPNTMADVWLQKSCAGCGAHKMPSVMGYRNHFAKCMGYPHGAADLFAHAVMHKHALMAMVPELEPFPGPPVMI